MSSLIQLHTHPEIPIQVMYASELSVHSRRGFCEETGRIDDPNGFNPRTPI